MDDSPSDHPDADGASSSSPLFQDTRWTLVLTVQRGDSEEAAAAALEELCKMYWYPLYAYVRRRGHSPADAEDLVQGFFARLIKRDSLQRARQERGRLRGFLLKDLQFYIRDEHAKAKAQKRGGHTTTISIDKEVAEQRWQLEVDQQQSSDIEHEPERVYDRQWAMTLLEETFAELRRDYRNRGMTHYYETLEPAIGPGAEAPSYQSLADALEMPLNSVKTAIFRLRQQFRGLLEKQVMQTVSTKAELDAELRYLIQLFS